MKKLLIFVLTFVILSSLFITTSADGGSIDYKNNETELINYVIKKFKDIKENDWYISYAIKLISKNIIAGKPQADGTVIFDPMGLVTKSEFTKMLVEAMDYNITDGNTFNDIGYDKHWAKKYIETAVAEGIIDPEDEGDYYWPDMAIKRLDMAMMMFKALELEPSNNPTPFPDIDSGHITKLYEEYLIYGSPEGNKVYFKPSGLTTRAEAAAIIARLVEYKDNPIVYKENKIAEAKANEFIEPEFEVVAVNSKTIYSRIIVNNYSDYDENYMFKAECLNYPQINKHYATGLWGPPIEVDRASWKTGDVIRDFEGRLALVQKEPYYLDINKKNVFQAEPGMVFVFKITVKKGEKIRNYTIPLEIPKE